MVQAASAVMLLANGCSPSIIICVGFLAVAGVAGVPADIRQHMAPANRAGVWHGIRLRIRAGRPTVQHLGLDRQETTDLLTARKLHASYRAIRHHERGIPLPPTTTCIHADTATVTVAGLRQTVTG
ncbi:hypothetical protein ACIQB5_48530 [Streptomyces sp. NPDC088560]|uniref:hypothetical protein n=1 Tax=Streptomyces sp. NPDC088560 TaxID=3365868 RepID=UPI00382055A1